MSRIARVVVPGLPHHVTQRGNRRQPVFFGEEDYRLYRRILAERAKAAGVQVWAYCLMPNHVHLILVPASAQGLAACVGETHRRYSRFVNARAGKTGHLFQGRFASVVMDEPHLQLAARYVALNPQRARLVARAADWPWSSLPAHLAGRDDELVSVTPLLQRIGDFRALVRGEADDPAFAALRAVERTGRPLGAPGFVGELERRLRRPLAPQRRGRKPQKAKVRRSTGRRRGNAARDRRKS
ncbi:MAG: transposase [Alphaproteobacteria bacterium]|nr:transposase [Alphaproteobacteria bacterium]